MKPKNILTLRGRAAFITGALLSLLAGPVPAEQITAEQIAGRIRSTTPDVLVVGEIHDNAEHHRNQATALAALQPRAVIYEMLSPEQAARITPALLDDPQALEQALDWQNSGWPAFALYYPVFAASKGARIIGAARPRAEVRRAMTEPLAEIFGPQAALYGLDHPYPPAEQAALEAETQASHCNALPAEMLPGMVAAQRLRDADFAAATLRARQETGGPVALITGSGHARTDRAVPLLIARAAPELRLLTIGQVEGDPVPESPPVPAQTEHTPPVAPQPAPPPFDLWITSPAPARDDPCASFR